MNACEQCGRQDAGGTQVGPFCESCIVESIRKIFVHAPDQPSGSIPVVEEQDGATTESSTSSGRSRGGSTPSSSITYASSARSNQYQAIRHPQQAFRRYTSASIRPIQQMQMLSSFLNTYFPTAEARADLSNRRSYLAALPDMEISSTPLLRVAVDTLCFAHIGSKTGDMRLVRESQNSYGKVLSSLIQATSREPKEIPYIDPKAIITSIMLLCLYDDSIPLPYQGKNGWAAHYWGCQQLLRAYGSSSLDMKEPFDRLLFWNLRMPLFFLGVAKRKSVVLGDPEWLALADCSSESQGPLTDFYRTAMCIPTLLENCDDILQSSDPQRLERLALEILKVRGDILTWYDMRIRASNGAFLEDPETISIVDDLELFDIDNEEHCFMTTSTAYEDFFKFNARGYVVKNHTLKTLCLLVLDCTLLRLLHFRPSTSAYIHPWKPSDVHDNALGFASDLCRSIYHYATFDNLAYADFTDFLEEVALGFFEEVGESATRELGWCISVRLSTKLRKERIRKTIQPRTLCRMDAAGPGFCTAMRFRTYNILGEQG